MVLSHDPNNLLAHLKLAELYEIMGEFPLASQQYNLLFKSPDPEFNAKGMEGLERLQVK